MGAGPPTATPAEEATANERPGNPASSVHKDPPQQEEVHRAPSEGGQGQGTGEKGDDSADPG